MSKPERKPLADATRPRGPYRESTTPIRVPRSLLGEVQALLDRHRRSADSRNHATSSGDARP